jgi:hypothetical protein
MPFAIPPDVIRLDPLDPLSGKGPRDPNRRRVSTTAALLGIVLCAILAKWLAVETLPPPQIAAAAQSQGATAVKIIAPEFCKDQTWPYIDARCLRRVDNPTPPIEERAIVNAPVITAAANTAPANIAAGAPAATDSASGSAAAFGASANNSGASPAKQVYGVQSTFPTATVVAVPQAEMQSASDISVDASAYQTGDPRHRHTRHWNTYFHFPSYYF